jgi:hypothetical protein
VSGRIGKRQSTIWNWERTGETARLGAHEALVILRQGASPLRPPAPFPSDLIVGAGRDLSRVRKPRQKPARPGQIPPGPEQDP